MQSSTMYHFKADDQECTLLMHDTMLCALVLTHAAFSNMMRDWCISWFKLAQDHASLQNKQDICLTGQDKIFCLFFSRIVKRLRRVLMERIYVVPWMRALVCQRPCICSWCGKKFWLTGVQMLQTVHQAPHASDLDNIHIPINLFHSPNFGTMILHCLISNYQLQTVADNLNTLAWSFLPGYDWW